MTLDEHQIAEAMRVTFELKPGEADLTEDAKKVLAMLQIGETPITIALRLANVQSRTAGRVVGGDCVKLAKTLVEAHANA